MRWTIGKRIFAAITLSSIVIVAISAFATRYSFDRSFSDYLQEQDDKRLVPIVERLAAFHDDDPTWLSLRENSDRWNALFRERRGPRGQHPPSPRDRRPPPNPAGAPLGGLELHDRVALIDQDGHHVIGPPISATDKRTREVPIWQDGQQIGMLLVSRRSELTDEVDIRFAAAQGRATLVIALLVLVIAALIAAILARRLTRPVRTLAEGTRELARGNFDTRITVAHDDELGDLARDFNVLAQTLQRNRDSRRQWVSDIAHELRTPLSILSGELQAIEDGVREFSDGTRQSLQAEIERLTKLVSDMHVLTSSDEGELSLSREPAQIFALINEVLDRSRTRLKDAGIEVSFSSPDSETVVDGDPMRLQQLLSNLIENSIRYTEPPGQIQVMTTRNSNNVIIAFADSKPGVNDQDLPKLFDRLYRVDNSRNRSTGGSGLGLAICSAIVEAHGGEISAHHAQIGGVEIVIQLPIKAPDDD